MQTTTERTISPLPSKPYFGYCTNTDTANSIQGRRNTSPQPPEALDERRGDSRMTHWQDK